MKRSVILTGSCAIITCLLASCATIMADEAKRRAEFDQTLKQEREARAAARATPTPTVKRSPEPLDGLVIPTLETRIQKPEQLKTIVVDYAQFDVSSRWVLEQAQAYGVRPQLKNVLLVRSAALYWKEFFAAMQVFPDRPLIQKAEIVAFYEQLKAIDEKTSQTVKDLNALIDRERTRPWVKK